MKISFLAFPSFFITVCYHTTYAAPWIFPPLAFYAFDLVMRQFRYRIKDAYLIRVDNQMTVIHIPNADAGFRAGQHLRLRVFFDGRGVFEAHPLSILCGPSEQTCLQSGDVDKYYKSSPDLSAIEEQGYNVRGRGVSPGILLGASVMGDWTKALNEFALKEQENALSSSPVEPRSSGSMNPNATPVPISAQVMFDGPYGGCSLDLVTFERVLLLAGGSGATFAVGALDELVAACCLSRNFDRMSTRTERVELVWCVRSFGKSRFCALPI